MSDSKNSTFYVQLEPRWRSWVDYTTKKRPLEKVVATRVSQTKPTKPVAGSITVKLSITIPDSVFEPFEPQVDIVIPEQDVQNLIQVNVEPAEVDDVRPQEAV